MEIIAKTFNFNVPFYKGPYLCLCIHCKDMDKIVPAYPVGGSNIVRIETEIDGKTFRAVAFISTDAKAFDGEVFKEEDVFWCDPKALHAHSKREYFPLKNLLFQERGGWIDSFIHIKRLVYRIL
jgi:hypothetical protein